MHLLPLALACIGLLPAGSTEDPPRKEPTASAPAHTGFAWTSPGGLRYVWWLPKGYAPKKAPRNLSVILHGTGLDYRWGLWNNPPGVFRPDDIVVSVDGTSAGQGESRLFLGKSPDAKAFKQFLDEMRETFAVKDVFLYGHSQGGFFVAYFAGEYPKSVAGVVAHASGTWNWSKTTGSVKDVAIAFLHGTMDPVVPYRQSPASRDHYVKQKLPLVHLRRLERYNHWPNAVRATETLDWCEGMTTDDASVALDTARNLLTVKPADQYRWETTVNYSGARDVLERLTASPKSFANAPSPKTLADAKKLIDRIEAAGTRHVKELRRHLGEKPRLQLDGKPWLGHLVALREDFRGVLAVESFMKDLGFDKLATRHQEAAGRILDAWYKEKDGPKIAETVFKELPNAFLFEGFPPELETKMKEWIPQIKKRDTKALKSFEHWSTGWKTGLEAYRKTWQTWSL